MKRIAALFVPAMLVSSEYVAHFTTKNWDKLSEKGQTCFIRFCQESNAQCQSMQPAWNRLINEFENNAFLLIADVDCDSSEGLCVALREVNSVPTILYGDPRNLKKYNGSFGFPDIQKIAKDLRPLCHPAQLNFCDGAERAQLAEFIALKDSERAYKIWEAESGITVLDHAFELFTVKFQERMEVKDTLEKEIQFMKEDANFWKQLHVELP